MATSVTDIELSQSGIPVLGAGARSHAAETYLNSLAPGPSRATMESCLNRLAWLIQSRPRRADGKPGPEPLLWRSVLWEGIRAPHVERLLALLRDEEKCDAATVRKYLAALRGVTRAAWRAELVTAETVARIRDVSAPAGERLPAGRYVDAAEISAMFAACDPFTPAGIRDGALLAVLYGGGMRRAEVAKLGLENVDDRAGELRIIGKRNRERVVHLPDGAAGALRRWLRLRGIRSRWVFPHRRISGAKAGSGWDPERRMSGQGVAFVLEAIARRAGLESPPLPHDFRRTFVTNLLDSGCDLALVQALAGHTDVKTTVKYDRRVESRRHEAVQVIQIPLGLGWSE